MATHASLFATQLAELHRLAALASGGAATAAGVAAAEVGGGRGIGVAGLDGGGGRLGGEEWHWSVARASGTAGGSSGGSLSGVSGGGGCGGGGRGPLRDGTGGLPECSSGSGGLRLEGSAAAAVAAATAATAATGWRGGGGGGGGGPLLPSPSPRRGERARRPVFRRFP